MWHWTSINITYLIIAIVLFFYSLYLWFGRETTSQNIVIKIIASIGVVWVLGYMIEGGSTLVSVKLIGSDIQYIGVTLVPTLWLIYVLAYSNHTQFLKPRYLALLFVLPITFLILAVTNPLHHLMWTSAVLLPDKPLAELDKTFNFVFFVLMAYSLTILIVSGAILLKMFTNHRHLYRRHINILLNAMLILFIGGAIEVMDPPIFAGIDVVPILFAIVALWLAWGLFRIRLTDVVPVTRDIVVDNMSDAVFVLDDACTIVDFNPRAKALFDQIESKLLGQKFKDILVRWGLDVECQGKSVLSQHNIRLNINGTVKHFDMQVSNLHDVHKKLISQIVVFRDVTAYKEIQIALQSAHDELEGRVQERTLALQESLTEKNVLLKEIHHRVKNNMQVVSSMLYLQGCMADDSHIAAALEEGRNRVQSMALIHEKLYQSENLARIDFGEYARELVSFLEKSQYALEYEIDINFNVQPFFLTVDAAVPAGLIINELVTNAFKHAFSERETGTLWIEMACDGDMVTLQVRDDGAGLPADFEMLKQNSLGMKLVSSLTNQLRGELTIANENGTTFRIVFPKS